MFRRKLLLPEVKWDIDYNTQTGIGYFCSVCRAKQPNHLKNCCHHETVSIWKRLKQFILSLSPFKAHRERKRQQAWKKALKRLAHVAGIPESDGGVVKRANHIHKYGGTLADPIGAKAEIVSEEKFETFEDAKKKFDELVEEAKEARERAEKQNASTEEMKEKQVEETTEDK
jgi:hypothetical protein